MTSAVTADVSCALAVPGGGHSLTAYLSKLEGPATARWFDPTNGDLKTLDGGPFPIDGWREFIPPGQNVDGDGDWVLILEAQ